MKVKGHGFSSQCSNSLQCCGHPRTLITLVKEGMTRKMVRKPPGGLTP